MDRSAWSAQDRALAWSVGMERWHGALAWSVGRERRQKRALIVAGNTPAFSSAQMTFCIDRTDEGDLALGRHRPPASRSPDCRLAESAILAGDVAFRHRARGDASRGGDGSRPRRDPGQPAAPSHTRANARRDRVVLAAENNAPAGDPRDRTAPKRLYALAGFRASRVPACPFRVKRAAPVPRERGAPGPPVWGRTRYHLNRAALGTGETSPDPRGASCFTWNVSGRPALWHGAG
ncbi:hypothetical protein Kfla_7079 [Kribbella flavida DSM 17836]|uniref:Uncharacterized protein n=1 Tax=Kribbella flavida (strain DSM 17836 / JCM 10339 / NBRC 14399) TaxID=479435 RepID=D2Q556_KRIFD|nr:hypothetical protein Kfla_7079 [Kribbella flavida DSM 17836]